MGDFAMKAWILCPFLITINGHAISFWRNPELERMMLSDEYTPSYANRRLVTRDSGDVSTMNGGREPYVPGPYMESYSSPELLTYNPFEKSYNALKQVFQNLKILFSGVEYGHALN